MEESLDHETEILGQRLAKDVAARVKVREVLEAKIRAFGWWQWLLIFVAVGIYAVLAGHSQSSAVTMAGAVTLASLPMAITALAECTRLRRRLDAAVVLLAETPTAAGSSRRAGGETPPAT